jgi:hypothetical protein
MRKTALIFTFACLSLASAQSTDPVTGTTKQPATGKHRSPKAVRNRRSTPQPDRNGGADRQIPDPNKNPNPTPTPKPNDQVNPDTYPVKPPDPTKPTVVNPPRGQ